MLTLRLFISLALLFLSGSTMAGYSVFDQPLSYPGGVGMTDIISTDLNNDGFADLVIANTGSNSIDVMLNAGDGTMLPRNSFNVGTVQRAIAAIDLDADGDLDLAVVTGGSVPNLVILLNSGNGTFQVGASYDIGDFTLAIEAADLDSDGDQDLIIANWTAGTVTVLINDGNANFPTIVNYSVGSANAPGVHDVAIADMNGDNNQDIIVAHEGDANVVILLNDGFAEFSIGETIGLSSGAVSIRVSDFDMDGNQDIATTIAATGTVALIFNNGNAVFDAPIYIVVGEEPKDLAVGDLDNDGDVDIVVTDNTSTSNDLVSILWNVGDGTFDIPDVYESGANMPLSVTISDFDGNGTLDLAVCHFLTFANSQVTILNNLLPTSSPVNCPCCTAGPGDLNGDTVLDIADLVHLVSFMFSGGLPPICE